MSDVKISVGVVGASEAAKAISSLRKEATAAGSDIARMQAQADAGMGGAARSAKELEDASGKAAGGIESLGHGLRGMGPVAAGLHESLCFLSSPLGILLLALTEFAKVVGEGKQKADEYKKATEEGGDKLEEFEKKLTDTDRAQMRLGETMTSGFHGIKEAMIALISLPFEPYIDRSVAAVARLESADKDLETTSQELARVQQAAAEQASKAYEAEAGKGQELFKTYLDAAEKSRKALAEWREEQIRSNIASGKVTPEEGAKQIRAVKADASQDNYEIEFKKLMADREASRERFGTISASGHRTVAEYDNLKSQIDEHQEIYTGNETQIREWRERREATAETMKQTGPTEGMQRALWDWDQKINDATAAQIENKKALEEAEKELIKLAPAAEAAREALAKANKERPLQVASEDEALTALQAGRYAETLRESTGEKKVDLEAQKKQAEEGLKADETHLRLAEHGQAPEQVEALHAEAAYQTAAQGGAAGGQLQRLLEAMQQRDAAQAGLVEKLTAQVESDRKRIENLTAVVQQLPGGN